MLKSSMNDCMIDIETLGVENNSVILTVAAQMFNPLGSGYGDKFYYARVDLDSQPNRSITQSTIDWWSQQPEESKNEAFNEQNRIDLRQVLAELTPMLWQSNRIWANGITFDMNILENAFRSYAMPLPWQYYRVRDARTIYSLCADLQKYPASHHALEDCRRQIDLLQTSFKFLKIEKLL
jgi:hypothetical protein